jgi:hypothetical protein
MAFAFICCFGLSKDSVCQLAEERVELFLRLTGGGNTEKIDRVTAFVPKKRES